jgi:FecR-like protein/outer membrane lipoprotein YfiO
VNKARSKRHELLARWSRLAVPVKSLSMDAERRDRLVGAVVRTMQRASVERGVRRHARGQIVFAAAMAAVLLVVLGIWREWGSSRGLAPRRPAPVADMRGAESVGGVVAVRGDGASGLRLPSGVVVTMKPETRFHMSDLSAPSNPREELLLDLGRVEVEVPRLPAGHVFAVRTPDALVTVHGTSFSVEVAKAASGATTTTVAVTRGVVSVLRADQESLLYAGMEWSSTAPLAVVPAPREAPFRRITKSRPLSPGAESSRSPDRARTSPAPAQPEASAAPVTAAPEVAPSPEASARTMDLANQNMLFAEAKLARQGGDQVRAVRLLEDLVRRYPSSPLIEDARVETFRALAQMGDRAGAAREARRYLALYQSGFARDEARNLALEP